MFIRLRHQSLNGSQYSVLSVLIITHLHDLVDFDQDENMGI